VPFRDFLKKLHRAFSGADGSTADDAIVGDLIPRWHRKPLEGSSVWRTIEALCAKRDVTYDKDGNLVGLPTNEELAEQLGLAVSTVRKHIEDTAQFYIDGAPMLPPRHRIYHCVWWERWLKQRQETPPTGSRVA